MVTHCSAGSGVGSVGALPVPVVPVEAYGRIAQQLLPCPWQRPRHRDASIRQALALRALAIVPEALRQEPILLSVDDTSIAKWGKHFDGVGILYDHAKHDGKSYFNGHAFVSLTMSVPVLPENAGKQQIRYIAVPIGYVMSNGEASKLTLACQLLDEVMPILEKR